MNLREEIAAHIVNTVQDPALWLLEVRRIATALRLNLARSIRMGETLDVTVFYMLDEAEKQGRKVPEMRAAAGI